VKYRFGSYVLTADRLDSKGRAVAVAAKPLAVLRELVARPREIVSNQELIQAAWGDLPVTDESLARAVFLLRQALGDNDCAGARYVETVDGHGYRFVAPVQRDRLDVVPTRARTVPVDPRRRAAQALCLQARSMLSHGRARVPQAVAAFEQAVAVDPSYVPALVGLGEANLWQAAGGALRPRAAIARARGLLRDAVRLEPGDARARACLAMLYGDFDWDVARAGQELAIALSADPTDPVVRWVHGRHLLSLGRCAAALDEFDACSSLDPGNVGWRVDRALYAFYARRFELAAAHAREISRQEPAYPTSLPTLSVALAAVGLGAAAADLVRPLLADPQVQPQLRPAAGLALAYAGDHAAARVQLALIERGTAEGQFMLPTATAMLAAQLGELGVALRWLDAAVQELCPMLPFSAVCPAFEPLHAEPRFRAIVRRIGREVALPAAGGGT
jgi:DNA-binding winged helix-turn-helix (wHTH) protein